MGKINIKYEHRNKENMMKLFPSIDKVFEKAHPIYKTLFFR